MNDHFGEAVSRRGKASQRQWHLHRPIMDKMAWTYMEMWGKTIQTKRRARKEPKDSKGQRMFRGCLEHSRPGGTRTGWGREERSPRVGGPEHAKAASRLESSGSAAVRPRLSSQADFSLTLWRWPRSHFKVLSPSPSFVNWRWMPLPYPWSFWERNKHVSDQFKAHNASRDN